MPAGPTAASRLVLVPEDTSAEPERKPGGPVDTASGWDSILLLELLDSQLGATFEPAVAVGVAVAEDTVLNEQ